MDKRIVKYGTYPLHEAVKGQKTITRFKEFQLRQNWSQERFLDFQQGALQKIVQYAYTHCRFYKERFDQAGIDQGNIRDISDLHQIPFLTKEDLRCRPNDLLSRDFQNGKGLVLFSTGGSTGEPTKFYVDRGRIGSEWAACWRARGWWGLDWGDKWVWLWGSPIELSVHDWVKQTRDIFLNRRLLSAFDLSEETMRGYIKTLRAFRPRYLYCYASSIYLFSAFLERSGISLADLGLQVIFTTSDTLYEPMRQTIEKVFGCPVAIEYGSRDGGFIAHECKEKRLHIHSDRVLLEFWKGDRPAEKGTLGEIILTSLDATAVPFIRYRTGDIGVLSDAPCPCGRPLPVIRQIHGRNSDFLITRTGRMIHGESISHILKNLDGIKQFQLRQKDVNCLTLTLSICETWKKTDEEIILRKLRHLFDQNILVTFLYVDKIAPAPSGKHRFVISEIGGQYWEGQKPQESEQESEIATRF